MTDSTGPPHETWHDRVSTRLRSRGASSTRWRRLVAAIPWLAQLPPALADTIDLDEIFEPVGRVADIRTSVEQEVGGFVLTYRRHPRQGDPEPRQLCRLLAPANLDEDAMGILFRAERRLLDERVVLCVYARPLQYRGPLCSLYNC